MLIGLAFLPPLSANLTEASQGLPPPVALRCEALVLPIAIQADRPRLTWELADRRRGARQTAYQVLISSDLGLLRLGRGDLFDSGRVASDRSVCMPSKPLMRGRRAFWAVRYWDQDGSPSAWSEPATFGVGPDPAHWKAYWIEDPTPATEYSPARNGFHTDLTGDPNAEKWVQIDLGERRAIDGIRLWPARPIDWVRDQPGFLFPLRYRILVSDDAEMKDARVVADRSAADVPNPGTDSVLVRLPGTVSSRYVRLLVTRQGEREPGACGFCLAELEILAGDANVARSRPVTSSGVIENANWARAYLTDGITASRHATGTEPLPAPTVRKEFSLGAKPVRAVAYVACLGLYELHVNGRNVSESPLTPEWTDYDRRVLAQAYDVTDLLDKGANTIGAILGDGWYAGRLGMSQGLSEDKRPRAVYGRKPKVRILLDIEMADGSRQTVGTDETWRTTLQGPIRSADLLDGVVTDLRLDLPGWDKPGYADGGWSWARAVEPKTIIEFQPNEPIRIVERLRAIAMTEPAPGVYVFDLGQNMPGWCRLRVEGESGDRVTLTHAEMLAEDGKVYTANLRGADQKDEFVLTAGKTTLEPKFTYHGFRYVQVEGLRHKPELGDLEGVVFCSGAREVGEFTCSDPMLTRLWQNILWTQRANLMSVPTDCPQRDERLGWMGDILIFAPTSCYQMDLQPFFRKWLADVRDAQADDGRYPDFAPHPYGRNRSFTGVPGWGDAGVFVPWAAYQFYDDPRLLADHFESARRWVDWIKSKNPDLIWRNARHNDYNDWLNGDTLVQEGWPKTGATVPNEVFATMYFAESTRLVAEMARVLGKTTEADAYRSLYESIRKAFQKAFVGADGVVRGDTQAGYALALSFDLVPESLRAPAFDRMVANLARYGNHMSTGFHSSHRMMLELARGVRLDLAYQLALQKTFPSWGYSIENGATTIWERWDGYVKGRGFQDAGMNSFNHWAFGAVGEWMMRVVVGIDRDPAVPGWRRAILAPKPGGGLSWAKGAYHSPVGRYEVSWVVEGEALTLDVVVPPNAEAILEVPTEKVDTIREGDRHPTAAPGVTPLGRNRFRLAAGTYRFTCSR